MLAALFHSGAFLRHSMKIMRVMQVGDATASLPRIPAQ
jgi:hypothetical protein